MTPLIAFWGIVAYCLGRIGIEVWFYFEPFRPRGVTFADLIEPGLREHFCARNPRGSR